MFLQLENWRLRTQASLRAKPFTRWFGVALSVIATPFLYKHADRDAEWYDYWPLVFVAILTGLVGPLIMLVMNRKRVEDEEHSIKSARADCTNRLHALNDRLDLGEDARLTFYAIQRDFEGVPKAFEKMGRYSKSPKLMSSRGRPFYPLNMGVLGLAYKEGTCFVADVLKKSPDGEWETGQMELGLPPAVASQLTMKSRSYYATVLKHSHSDECYGVLMIESNKAGTLKRGEIEYELELELWSILNRNFANAARNAREFVPLKKEDK